MSILFAGKIKWSFAARCSCNKEDGWGMCWLLVSMLLIWNKLWPTKPMEVGGRNKGWLVDETDEGCRGEKTKISCRLQS